MTPSYAITGVWFKENKKGSEHISHVMLHEIVNNSINKGIKASKEDVVTLLKLRTIKTLKWNYKDANWQWGATVSSETRNNITYLRSIPDGDVTNNLDNLINMSIFNF